MGVPVEVAGARGREAVPACGAAAIKKRTRWVMRGAARAVGAARRERERETGEGMDESTDAEAR